VKVNPEVLEKGMKKQDPATGPLDNPSLYINRELSWLSFTRRILGEAEGHAHPLLERVKFLALCGSNLDEFFMIRVSGLRRQQKGGVLEVPPDGMTPDEQLARVRVEVLTILSALSCCWRESILPGLEQEGIRLRSFRDLPGEDQRQLREHFEAEIAPVLTPLAFDASHPFPFISNLSLNLAVTLRDPARGELLARVKVPTTLFSRFIPVPPGGRDKERSATFVLLEDLVASCLDLLFPGMTILSAFPFRVTRDADIEIREDEASDLLTAVEEGMEARRTGFPVRLEIDQSAPRKACRALAGKLELPPSQVYLLDSPLGYVDFMELTRVSRPELKDTPFLPSIPPAFLQEKDIFGVIRLRDVLLFHPYESFLPVVSFLRQAALDPDVLAIKMTLYRIDANSPLVEALIEARQNGKQVAAVVELKARFDEKRNILWARALERAGVHVVYGMSGLKVHGKMCMVVRREGDHIVRYVHLGTGNYNATTARLYSDLGLLTTDPEIGADVADLFNMLTGYSKKASFRKLLVAPLTLRKELMARIEREERRQKEHGDGYLAFKVNGIEDKEAIKALYHASKEGVVERLDVRGICCLRPGIPGVSDTIRVTSIVDRFLEHARIYHFHNGGDEEVLLGSADLRPRNLDRRIEILFPISEPGMKKAILENILAVHLRDNTKAWELGPDGCYHRIAPREREEAVHSQQWFLEHRGSWQSYDGE
jgi:polyphosphate kinase